MYKARDTPTTKHYYFVLLFTSILSFELGKLVMLQHRVVTFTQVVFLTFKNIY